MPKFHIFPTGVTKDVSDGEALDLLRWGIGEPSEEREDTSFTPPLPFQEQE